MIAFYLFTEDSCLYYQKIRLKRVDLLFDLWKIYKMFKMISEKDFCMSLDYSEDMRLYNTYATL